MSLSLTGLKFGLYSLLGCLVLLVGGWVTMTVGATILLASPSPVKVLSATTSTTPIPTEVTSLPTPAPTPKPPSTEQLQIQLAQIAAANPGLTLSVIATDVIHDKTISLQPTKQLTGASTTKLITAGAVLTKIDSGKAALTDLVRGLTIQEQLRLMVNQSNNSAWDALNQWIGLTNLQKYATNLGLTGFKVKGNLVTAQDLATVLTKLYQGKLLSIKSTQLLVGLMEKTNEQRLIPAAVPNAMTVYHKYGWLDGDVHDAAIIVMPLQTILLVIMTQSSQSADLAKRAPLFGQITQMVVAATDKGW